MPDWARLAAMATSASATAAGSSSGPITAICVRFHWPTIAGAVVQLVPPSVERAPLDQYIGSFAALARTDVRHVVREEVRALLLHQRGLASRLT